jgi:hypothetical protein
MLLIIHTKKPLKYSQFFTTYNNTRVMYTFHFVLAHGVTHNEIKPLIYKWIFDVLDNMKTKSKTGPEFKICI